MAANDLAFVHRALAQLEAAGCRAWVFGGWAEELRGLAPPRPHRDLDLLVDTDQLPALEAFLRGAAVREIAAKRLPHKRAFLLDGVMVEALVVARADAGRRFSDVFGLARLPWPDDAMPAGGVAGLRVASCQSLCGYRRARARLPRYEDLALLSDADGVLRPGGGFRPPP
jgi:hypothetical protein